jgi:mRNA-degrading endonuclease toxin of MazEF toxin-antitoxin module
VAYRGTVRRWQVFRADLEPHVGREQAGEARPVLVISNDAFNAHFDVVTVLPLTKLEGKGRDPYPFEVVLPEGAVSEDVTSIVMPYQVRTVSTMRLLEPMGSVQDPNCRSRIEDRLREHLGIEYTY